MLILPTQDAAHYTYQIELDSVLFEIALDWNDREERWYMGIGNPATGPILAGAKLLLDSPLTVPAMAGAIIAVDTSNTATEAGYGDLGGRVQVLYVSPEDVA